MCTGAEPIIGAELLGDAGFGMIAPEVAEGAGALGAIETGIPAAAFAPEAANVVYGVAGVPTAAEAATGIAGAAATGEGSIPAPPNEGSAAGSAPSTSQAAALDIATGGTGGTAGAANIAPGIAPTAAAPSAITPPPVTTTAPSASGLPVGSGDASVAEQVLPPGSNPSVVPPSGPTTPPPSTGITKALEQLGVLSPGGGIGKNALPLGLTAISQLSANARGKSLQKDLKSIAQPSRSASEQLLAEGTSGQVPPAVMQQFQRSYNDKVNEITQRFANMGRDAKTDSAAQAEIAKAKDAMDAQVANYASSLTTQGLQAAGVASGPATQAALAGAQQDQALSTSMAGTLQNMALLDALSRDRNTPAAPPAG